VKEMKFDTKVA